MFAALAAALVLAPADNQLSAAESRAGWKLLFDGKSTKGWRNYKAQTVGKGWVIKDGTLVSVDPNTAGDIITTDTYDWFELKVDFNLEKGQNSGIMFRVTEQGETPWQSGPEVQLYDHPVQDGVETTGFLYQIYSSKVDAAKPAGQWNTLRLLVSPKICEVEINGKKLYDFKYGSADFWARINKTKFNEYPFFAKAERGAIGIQGDHGVVAFRNVKIRPIK